MELEALKAFFMWCTIINGSLLVFWSLWLIATPTLVYRLQSRWFPMPRETWNVVIYSFLGFFKLVVIVFNLVPFIALSIMTSS